MHVSGSIHGAWCLDSGCMQNATAELIRSVCHPQCMTKLPYVCPLQELASFPGVKEWPGNEVWHMFAIRQLPH